MQNLTRPEGWSRYWEQTNADDWADVLATLPLFEGVGRRRLRRLAEQATIAEYARGDTVVQAGSPGDALYVILGGSARARGKPAARTLRIGDYFGELGVFGGAPRSATVVATEELHVIRIPGDAVLRLARKHPALALRMLNELGSHVRRLEAAPARAA